MPALDSVRCAGYDLCNVPFLISPTKQTMTAFYETNLESNFKEYIKILQESLDPKKFDIVANLISNIFGNDRVATCPCATSIIYHGAYPGGMVEYCLRIHRIMVGLNNLRDESSRYTPATIATVSLLGGVGYLGTTKEPLFLEETSVWHRKNRGDFYKFNPDLPYMASAHRSLFILQGIGFKLTQDEYVALLLLTRNEAGDRSLYNMKEPALAEDYFYASKVAAREMHKEHAKELEEVQKGLTVSN